MTDIIKRAREAVAATDRIYSPGEWKAMVEGLLLDAERYAYLKSNCQWRSLGDFCSLTFKEIPLDCPRPQVISSVDYADKIIDAARK